MIMLLHNKFFSYFFVALWSLFASYSAFAYTSHGIATYRDLKYSSNFKHFDYVNPNAPKGGETSQAVIGSFDSLNPFILKGVAAEGLNFTFDTLMSSSKDETASSYGLLAESVEIDDNGSWVIFTLRNNAKFHNNTPLTAEDVVFSFNRLKNEGDPSYKAYYRDITEAKILSKYRVKFIFADNKNRELPLIAGQFPIFSKQEFNKRIFNETTLIPLQGSGPYIVDKINPGRSIIYKRNPNYWGKNLPVNKGRYNFDSIRLDYYRDSTVAIEALKAGEYDFRRENISKNWAKTYNIEQVDNGRMIKEEIADGTPTGMQSFVFNIRRDLFKDIRVRKALSYAYDFEWTNRQLFYGAYKRNTSYFGNSVFAATGKPSAEELNLLYPYKDQLPKEVFTTLYAPPKTLGDGNARDNLKKAVTLLEEAGWFYRDLQLINPATDKPAEIEFLITSPSFERVIAPFLKNLKKIGIKGTIRTVDSSQYIKRLEEFDYDITVFWFAQGPSPGNEQINFWHSSRADIPGSRNMVGIKNPAVDALVEKIISSSSKNQLITATKALDRVLSWNYYVIPHWFSRTHRVIYWNKFSRPKTNPTYALGFLDTWWIDKDKLNNLTKEP